MLGRCRRRDAGKVQEREGRWPGVQTWCTPRFPACACPGAPRRATLTVPSTHRKAFRIIDGEPMRWLGVVLFAAGGALRIWPVFVLGHRFSGLVAIQPGHTLVTSGVYGVIRHPSYLGLLVNALGWDLAFRAGLGVLLTALMIPPLLARIRAEEQLLRSQFGDEYGAYCARTARLIPGLY